LYDLRCSCRKSCQILATIFQYGPQQRRQSLHIHWSGKGLDWERFDTHEEAEKGAEHLALPGETFIIEEHGQSCPQCMPLMKRIPGTRDGSNEATA
jgi:hypothetical protein